MRSRKPNHEEVAEVARRRLEQLSAELAGIRPGPVGPPDPDGRDGPGEQPEAPAGAVTSSPTRSGRHARSRLSGQERLGGWLHDRLPPTLQGRVQLGASHLSVVAFIVAAALAATCWWVLKADGSTTSVPSRGTRPAEASPALLVTPAASPAAPPSTSPAASGAPSPSGTIIVDVAGKVRRPGIATLPLGARVVDALRAAGGTRRGVALGSLNLARVLTDGEQIVVGLPAPAGVAASAASAPTGSAAPALVNINTAGQTELETLPGVGPVTAQAILKWRSDNGAFKAVDELLEVSGIGQATLAKIAPFVTL